MNMSNRLFGSVTLVIVAMLLAATLSCKQDLGKSEGPGKKSDGVSEPPGKKSEIVECLIKLANIGPRGRSVELRLTDSKLIKEIVEDPLSKAQVDPRPPKFEIPGELTITRKDGSEENVALSLPWGRCKYEGRYLFVDFRDLRKCIRESLKDATRLLESD